MKANIVILSNIEWGFLKQRHQFLAENLAENGYHVVFVESAAKRNITLADIPRIIKRLKKNFSEKKKPTKSGSYSGIHIVTPIVLPSTLKFFRVLNKLIFINKLGKKISSKFIANLPVKVIWYAPTSTTRDLLSYLKPVKNVYDCVSNFEAFKNMPNDTVAIENNLIKQADVVCVDCDFLLNKHKHKCRRIELIEPAVDFELFNAPFKVRVVSKQIKSIVYYGQLESISKNPDLLVYLSQNGYDITVIGTVVEGTKLAPSVTVKPPVPNDQLPHIIGKFDAVILPYNNSEFSNGVIPAKVFECFAVGLPIIASLSYNLNKYSHLFITGNTYEEILSNLKNYSAEKEYQRSADKLQIAKEHSWGKFTELFVNVLEN